MTDRVAHAAFAGLERVRGSVGAGAHARNRAAGDGRRDQPATRLGRPRGRRAGGHVMQGSAWAEHRRAQGADPRFVTFSDGRVALVVLRRQRLAPGLVATCRRGPTPAGLSGTELAGHVAVLGDALRDLGARELFVDPELDADRDTTPPWTRWAPGAAEFQPSIHVMRLTFPPDATEETVFGSIQKATRQRIRAAERVGTTVRLDVAGERLDEFGEVLVERADALGIAMRPSAAISRRGGGSWRRGRPVCWWPSTRACWLVACCCSSRAACTRPPTPPTMRRSGTPARHHAPGALDGHPRRAGRGRPRRGAGWGGPARPSGAARPHDPNRGLYVHKASFGATWVVRTPARRLVLRPGAVRLADARDELVGVGRRATRAIPGLQR
ncbi:MAG: hypothetical protein U0667_16315 [Chloroflexota bacterium]